MKKYPLFLFIGIFTFSAIANYKSFSQSNSTFYNNYTNVLTTAVPFLLITPDSRSGAMGDAGVALPADANSIHWNPAKLAFVPNDFSAALSYVPWLRKLVPDISLSYITVYKKIDQYSTFGGSLRYFSLGDIEFTDINGSSNGSWRPYEMALDGAYARKLSDNFSLGLSLRFIYSNLTGGQVISGGVQTKAGIAFAGDLSAYWHLADRTIADKTLNWNFGINASNIGSKITYTDKLQRDFIPINLRVGTYLNYHIDEYNELALALDLNKLMVPTTPLYDSTSHVVKGRNPDVPVMQGIFQSFTDAPGGFTEEMREIDPAIGFEYWYNRQFAARTGYFYESKYKGNRQYITLGIGVKYSILDLDVSYLIPTNNKTASESSPLENTVRFTLLFNFGTEGVKTKK
jgi:hypothetical protein